MSQSSYQDGILREWKDDQTRKVYIYDEAGVEIVASRRDYTPEENLVADADVQQRLFEATRQSYLDDLAAGIPNILAARDAASADAESMDPVIADLIAKRDAVAAFAIPSTYSQATITAIKNELIAIRNFMINQAQYRKAVDNNAVTTDNALLWVGRVITDTILD